MELNTNVFISNSSTLYYQRLSFQDIKEVRIVLKRCDQDNELLTNANFNHNSTPNPKRTDTDLYKMYLPIKIRLKHYFNSLHK